MLKIGSKVYPAAGGPEYERLAGAGMTARGGTTPVRGEKSLRQRLQEAESDADLLKLKKSLEARGIDTSGIREFDGL